MLKLADRAAAAGAILSLVLVCACGRASAPPANRPGFGEVMERIGAHFERLGRAERAGSYELAEFDLEEIEEAFGDDLPQAEPPRKTGGVNLPGLSAAWLGTHPPQLREALKRRDPKAFGAAFALAAETCNGCHRETEHPFIVIPATPGESVPVIGRARPR